MEEAGARQASQDGFRRFGRGATAAAVGAAGLALLTGSALAGAPEAGAASWGAIFTPGRMMAILALAGMSSFCSASEAAFFSIGKVRLRTMRETGGVAARLVARLMDQPGGLLATLLIANNVVNILIGVLFGAPMARVFDSALGYSPTLSYLASTLFTTLVLVVFCEVLPKVVGFSRNTLFAQAAAFPLYLLDRAMRPFRDALMRFTALLFRVTRFSEVPPAPFMTDDEFKSLLEDSRASGVIEEDERQMIEGIIEFGDKTVRDILVPRPDVIAIPEGATAGEALEMFREQECSRMPVYRGDLDHITGVLYAKDLLPVLAGAGLDEPVERRARRAHFVPETMTLADFMNFSQRSHAHIAVVADEYGGTEGLVTLQDAIREVVGDVGDDDEEEEFYFEEAGEGLYRVDGTFSLDELEKLTGISVDDEEHTTVAGFLMAKFEKIPETGDEMEYSGVHFRIEETDGKRVTRVLLRTPAGQAPAADAGGDAP